MSHDIYAMNNPNPSSVLVYLQHIDCFDARLVKPLHAQWTLKLNILKRSPVATANKMKK